MPNARRSNTVKHFNNLSDYEGLIKEPTEIETVLVILQKNLIMKVRGKVTQNLYVFNGAGSQINVDKRDVEGMNDINTSHISCCGGQSSPYFEIH
jgi:hypothetical protein